MKKWFGIWLRSTLVGGFVLFALVFCYDVFFKPGTEEAQVPFNEGVAHFQQKRYSQALSAFMKAKALTENPTLKAWSLYNSGNCSFYEAQEKKNQAEVAGLYLKSLGHYEEALTLLLSPFLRAGLSLEQMRQWQAENEVPLAKLFWKDPYLWREAMRLDIGFLKDVAYNIEVVKKALLKLAPQVPQANEEQKKQQEVVDQLKKIIENQAYFNQENTNLWQKQKKEGKKVTSEIAALAQAQQQNQEETQEVAQKIQKAQKILESLSSALPALTKAQVYLDNALSFQKEAQPYLRQAQLAEALPNQQEALSELKKALQELLRSPTPKQGLLQKAAPQANKPSPQKILEEEEQNQKRTGEGKKEADDTKTKDW